MLPEVLPPNHAEVWEVEIESIREMLARAAVTGHIDWHSAQGSTSFWMCKVRCWRWLFGNNIPILEVLPPNY